MPETLLVRCEFATHLLPVTLYVTATLSEGESKRVVSLDRNLSIRFDQSPISRLPRRFPDSALPTSSCIRAARSSVSRLSADTRRSGPGVHTAFAAGESPHHPK